MRTPIDLRRVMKIEKPSVQVRYELEEIGTPAAELLKIENKQRKIKKADIWSAFLIFIRFIGRL